MKEIYPNYYKKFKCIADKCRHSCCIGWEIDVDEATLAIYNSMSSPLGERIRNNIQTDGDTPHFVLQTGDRCPFLNEKGLCDIITECGEDALCDICRLHPRFRNFYSCFTETGLGLCCEEAARIILAEQGKFSVELPDDTISEEEQAFFSARAEIFSILQDRSKSIPQRFYLLAEKFDFKFDFKLDELCDTYLSLERLDENWTEMLEKLKKSTFDERIFSDDKFATMFEQLAVYFVFRHLPDTLYDRDYTPAVKFSVMSCYLIGALWSLYGYDADTDIDGACDIARMYSSEVEYSEDNMEQLMYLI